MDCEGSMSLINYIKETQCNEDGTYYVTTDQLYRMRKAHVELRRLAWRLMRGFKCQADKPGLGGGGPS